MNFEDWYNGEMLKVTKFDNQWQFSMGVVHKLRGPIFDLFLPPTYLSWTFVDICCTTYPLSTWTYENLTTYPLCTICN